MAKPTPYVNAMAQRIHRLITEGLPMLEQPLQEEVTAQQEEWKARCEGIGVDPSSREFMLASLAFMQLLFELLGMSELSDADPCQRHTLQSVAFTVAVGIFGQEYIDSHREEGSS